MDKKLYFQITILLAIVAVVSLIVGAVFILPLPASDSSPQFLRILIVGLAAFVSTIIVVMMVALFFGPIVPNLLARLADLFHEKASPYLPSPEPIPEPPPNTYSHYNLDLFQRFKWLTTKSSPNTNVDTDKTFTSRVKNGFESLCNLTPDGAELWVIASGKGGVGKSLISLGLLEALSRDERVLLLDFDLHNCGLTSLLKLKGDDAVDSTYSLIEEFRRMLSVDGASEQIRQLLENQYQLPPNFDSKEYNNIKWKFQSVCRLAPEVWSNFADHDTSRPKLRRIAPDNNERMPIPGDPAPLTPWNAFVMPSRVKDQRLLLMPVSFLSYVAVFLFLRAMRSSQKSEKMQIWA